MLALANNLANKIANKLEDAFMTQNRIRTALMDAAIAVVARDGLDKLTTRSIASECDLHDTYIYRYFLDKEDLLKRAFLREDKKMVDLMLREDFLEVESSLRDKLYKMWMPAWEYLLEHPDNCKFYVRYYYSVHFQKDAITDFEENNRVLKRRFKEIFSKEQDIELLFHYNIDTMLLLAMRVATGELENREELKNEVFELMYSINKVYSERYS